tara:strand:- start:260 stop:436 length:177 start_codon:yes stop_codon:yes gene_type:complete
MKINFNKKIYSSEAFKESSDAFKEFLQVDENEEYFIAESEDKEALLEFSNYLLAENKK